MGTVNVHRDDLPTFNWIDRKTGERQGKFVTEDAIYSSPTVWGEVVLVGCRDHHLYAFDRRMKQTQPVWSFKTRSYIHASPVVVGDTVLVASFDGNLYALRQAKPISVWADSDIVPRWFMAALARQLHEETASLVIRATTANAGNQFSLTDFQQLLKQTKERVQAAGAAPKVLPRDVPSDHPGAPFIEYVLTAGLLAGYPDGAFHPDDPTTRYQFVSGLSAVLAWLTRPNYIWRVLKDNGAPPAQVEVRADPLAGRTRTMPADVEETHWAYPALSRFAELGLLHLDDEGNFRGAHIVTVAEAARQWNLLAQSVKVVRVK